jgi:tetratricopeptide (TPR) repeat protein
MRWSVLLVCVVLAACAAQPAVPIHPEPLFNDAAFRPRSIRTDIDVFALSAAMRRFLETDLGLQLRQMSRLEGFIDAIQNGRQLKLKYDASVTRTAAEAFDLRAGNCISLIIMTAALAKELGLPVYYQRVHSDQIWSRDGDILFRSGHVNLTLRRRLAANDLLHDRNHEVTVDFLPEEDVRGYKTSPIEERTVVAMYMNNRAAESLARGKLDDAYWWAREAVVRDNDFLEAYNTLGVIYRQHGDLQEAERVSRLLLLREPDNPTFISNRAAVLSAMGQQPEAQALLQRLQRIEPYPPFHFMDQAQLALAKGDFAAAIKLFNRELARDPDYHAAHFGLAAAYFQLGEFAPAQEHLAAAMQNSTTRRDHDLYAAKLERLRAYQTH